jgi:hypothetical protein
MDMQAGDGPLALWVLTGMLDSGRRRIWVRELPHSRNDAGRYGAGSAKLKRARYGTGIPNVREPRYISPFLPKRPE